MKTLKRLAYLVTVLSTLMLDVYADIYILGGSSNPPTTYDYTPLLNTLSTEKPAAIPIELINTGLIETVAVNSDGIAFLSGINSQSGAPLIYTLNLFSNEITLLSNPNSNQEIIYTVAACPNGNAIFAGEDQTNLIPLAYLLEKGSNTLISITFPLDASGYIKSVAVGSDNVAILTANNDDGSSFIYKLQPESLMATSVSLTPTTGLFLNDVAIGPDLRAIIGGNIGNDTKSPVIYAVDSGSDAAYTIGIPSSDEGVINILSIRSDGTAFLAGANSTNNTPSIYILTQKALSASIFDTTLLPPGAFYTVSVASDGSTIFGGTSILNTPIVYRLNSELNSLTLINNPNGNLGYIASSASDSQGNVILVGEDYTSSLPLIYSISSGSDRALFIQSLGSVEESYFFSVAIYISPPHPTPHSSKILYDINRIKPINAEQVIKTKLKLNQAGIR